MKLTIFAATGGIGRQVVEQADQGRAAQALPRPGHDGGRPPRQRPGLDHRPAPRLTDKLLTGAYRTAYGRNLRRGLLVSRADVAHLMLRVLGQPETIKQVIGIAN